MEQKLAFSLKKNDYSGIWIIWGHTQNAFSSLFQNVNGKQSFAHDDNAAYEEWRQSKEGLGTYVTQIDNGSQQVFTTSQEKYFSYEELTAIC